MKKMKVQVNMKKYKIYFIFLFIYSFHLSGFCGSQDGPFLIWVNLSENKNVEDVVQKHIKDQDECIPAAFSMQSLPSWIDKDLVVNSIIKEEKQSILKLDRLLRKPYSSYINEGFDGIIVYDEKSGPRFSSMVRNWKAVARKKIGKKMDDAAIWSAFCVLIPPITRPI